MARPRKWRKVCCMPESNLYGPINGLNKANEIITMAIEEYEALRLIDLEGLTQEECAEKMQVARTTVQNIYNDARIKIAESLVNGKMLQIEGGDYKLYSENERMNCCGRCRRNGCSDSIMTEEIHEGFHNHSQRIYRTLQRVYGKKIQIDIKVGGSR